MIWISGLSVIVTILALAFIIAVAREAGQAFWRHQYDDAQHKLTMAEAEIARIKIMLADAETKIYRLENPAVFDKKGN